MHKKILKYITGAVTITVSAILVYGIFTGDLENYILKLKNMTKSEEKNISSMKSKEYPPGEVIEDYVNAFDWVSYPSEKRYDPDNKNMKWLAYGRSKEQEKYLKKMCEEQALYDKTNSLESEYSGPNKINPSSVVQVGEEMDLRQDSMKVTINNIEIMDNVTTLDENYFVPEVRESELVNSYDKYGNLLDGVQLVDYNTLEPLQNQKLSFIKVNLTVKSYSNWVTEIPYITPMFMFCTDNQKYISGIDGYIAKNGENFEGYSYGAMYFDLGSYSYQTYKEQNSLDYSIRYPMRIGEEVTFNAVYVCPEQLINNAYLSIGSNVSYGVENQNQYNNIFTKVIKVTR